MAFAGGSGLDTPQKGWVDAQFDSMKGGGMGGVGAGLSRGLDTVPGLDSGSAKGWIDQQIGGMKSAAAPLLQNQGAAAASWVDQQLGSGAGIPAGLGGLGSGPQLGALGSNFGGDPLQQQAEAARSRQLMQMMGSAGLAPGGGLGAANPLGGLI